MSSATTVAELNSLMAIGRAVSAKFKEFFISGQFKVTPLFRITGSRCKTHSQRYDDIDAEHDIQTHHILLAFMATPNSVGHVSFTLRLRKVSAVT